MSASERAQGHAASVGSEPSPAAASEPRATGPAGSPRETLLRVLREVVAPLVHADGGEIHLISADDSGVVLHLSGRYAGCPGNTLARRRVIEPLIAAAVPGAAVSISSGSLFPPGAELLSRG